MSLLYMMVAIIDLMHETCYMTEPAMYAWALFSIADALWIRTLLGK